MSVESLFRTVDSRYGRMTYFANDIGAVSQSLENYGEWAENELAFMKALIPPGATVVDVGAYIGTHTLAFAHFVGPEGRVISIEPQGETFALLKRNVAAKRLRNVRLKHAAAADHVGTLYASPIHIPAKESFGSAALDRFDLPPAGIAARRNQQREELIRVRALTIDSLQLGSCTLMKIDVEGFEDLVISGAKRTIKRLSPVIYAECNSIENGLKTFGIMRELGYEVRMHVVDAFNHNNFLGLTKNIFGPAREVALVGVSGMQLAIVDEMRPRPCELILKIACADDLALGMLNKPQYTCEVLQISGAARSGGDAWLRETSAALSERDKARDIAHQAQQEACQARTEADASRAQMEAAVLQARLAREATDQAEAKLADLFQRFEKLRTSLDEARANLVRARADNTELNQELAAMRASRSWRVTKPLRMVKHHLRKVFPVSGQNDAKTKGTK